jgi:hypothetical protein
MPDAKPPAKPAARSAAAAAPTPTTPTDGAVVPLDAVTFRWAAPPGAAAFSLRVAAAEAPDAPLVELADLPTTETTLADALPAGDLIWWVRRGDGPWSRPARFRAGTPADVEAAQRDEAAEAERQRAAEREARRLPAPPPEAPPDPVWPHARGEALEGAPALDWSTVPGFGPPARADERTVETDPPRPLGPLGGEVVDAVTVSLRWTAVPGARAYDVELSPAPAFDRDVLSLDAGGATEVTLPGLVPATGHRLLWRVRARTADGPTAWSKYGRFYPAADAAVEDFRTRLDEAHAAQRRQREHARAERERERDLVPHWEREDSVTDWATAAVTIGMLITGLVISLVVLLFSFFRF